MKMAESGLEIAVIGMAGRFPGAGNIAEFRENLENGVEGISFFGREELEQAGIEPVLVQSPNYIKVRGLIEDIDYFDSAFFGYIPAEAELMDPQVRIFHECAWEALEDAGVTPGSYKGRIGLYAGASPHLGWEVLSLFPGAVEAIGRFAAWQLYDKDFMSTRVSYNLDLSGPSVNVQTACSTSLVAIHLACQGLLSGECHMALAGGITVSIAGRTGYLYQEGLIGSSDGHCRPFDAAADGTVYSEGAGIVVLKLLENAVKDRDFIDAVIKSSAINNDGKGKVGFTAPGVKGQAAVIKSALRMARVKPETIGYVETHGTGTHLGDPAEIEALKQAFNTDKKGFCRIGSVKSNLGHTDNAAGVAGFIKTVLALKHGLIPPSLHCEKPNPKIDFENSPFIVNRALFEWQRHNEYPRRAGVSSFGVGGTNAHVVLEEYLNHEGHEGGREYRLMVLSAKTKSALEKMTGNLVNYLKQNPHINPADAAYTLQVGRKAFAYRRMFVWQKGRAIEEALENSHSSHVDGDKRPAAFTFSGQDAEEIGRAWLRGAKIDWTAFYRGEQRRRVPLPTYPFEDQHFPIAGDPFRMVSRMLADKETPSTGKRGDIADWFYVPLWEESVFPPPDPGPVANPVQCNWLVFSDTHGLSSLVIEKLRRDGREAVTVEAGPGFKKKNDREFVIDPGQENHYNRLFNELKKLKRVPHKILHLWCVGDKNDPAAGFYSLLAVARAIGRQGITNDLHIGVVTANMQDVSGDEALCPGKAVLLGAVKTIPAEYPNLRCCSMDIENYGRARETGLLDDLLAEFAAGLPDPVVAFRRSQRWVPVIKPIRVRLGTPGEGELPLKEKGVYLITGGLGGIGLTLAGYLAESVKARLVLTGRSSFPARAEWTQWLAAHDEHNDVSRKIRRLLVMENHGAGVMVCRADVADREQMREVVALARERFGPIHGVIHAAGVADGRVIQRRTREISEKVFAAKIGGTLVLDSLLKDEPLNFFILCSSLASILTPLGQVAYNGANAFLDAFASYKTAKDNIFCVAVGWDSWQEVGMAAAQEKPELIGHGLSPAEGVEVFRRVLAQRFSRLAVSTRDLPGLLRPAEVPGQADPVEGPEKPAGPLRARPSVSKAYAAPTNETEKKLTAIWQDFLGIAPIGIHDDFFELGGDSLKVMTISSKIHKRLAVEIPLGEFFNRPTIAALAAYISGAQKIEYAGIEPVEKKEYYPLSSAQKRLYFLDRVAPNSTVYNLSQFFMLEAKDFDGEKIAGTFGQLIQRHESLRTSFKMRAGEPVQIVNHVGEIEFGVEYDDIPGGEIEEKEIIRRFVRPFDLSRAPLLRVGLVDTGQQKYLLILDLHHITADGTSQIVLIEDFAALYFEGPLPGLRIQYKDFSAWQNHLFLSETGVIKSQEDYWLDLYADASEIPRLPLPSDYIRPGVFTFAGEHYGFLLGSEDTAGFKALGTGNSATLYMNILAVLNVLFYKYSGHTDIVIGSGIAGRPHVDLRPIIGMFVNTLAMRNYPGAEKTYGSFLKEVAANSVRAFENQDVQFEELVGKLEVERDPSRNPLFDISMVVQNVIQTGRGISPSKKTYEDPPFAGYKNTTAKFDMTFYIYQYEHGGAEEIYIDIEYYTGVFKQETIRRLAAHFKNIVKAIIKEPPVKLKDIAILSAEERRRVLYEFNDTTREYPRDRTLHGLFEDRAAKVGDRVAAVHPGTTEQVQITYKELNEKSNRLAGLLKKKGIRTGAIVAIMLERSLEMIAAVLGILKAGGAYLPIDPDYPKERIDYMLADSRAGHPSQEGTSNHAAPARNPLAYIMYTSGSTGRPKGVMVAHKNAVRLVVNTDYVELTGQTRILQTGAPVFDATTFEIWGALLNGGQLVLVDKEVILDALRLGRAIQQHRINTLWLSSPLFNRLAGENSGIFSTLDYLLVGGDVLTPAYINRVRSKCKKLKIINGYGPTENTTFSTTYLIDKDFEGPIPIGGPIANSTAYIVDRSGNLQPVGVFGELWVGGDGVARGYLNNPQLTAEKFLTAKTREGARRIFSMPHMSYMSYMSYKTRSKLYKTGDLCRWLADGNIEFGGRMDRQVKVRGYRIELEEIEARLLAHPLIKEALVLGVNREKEDEETCLCAYFCTGGTVGESVGVDSGELKEYLSAGLPSYMVPGYFVRLEGFPLTPNGKIDRGALPPPEPGAGAGMESVAAPADETEEKLVEIWSDVLGIDKIAISVDANFFDLGGHSLRLVKMNARIKDSFNIDIPVGELFGLTTVELLAGYIRQDETGPGSREEFPDESVSTMDETLGILMEDGDETG